MYTKKRLTLAAFGAAVLALVLITTPGQARGPIIGGTLASNPANIYDPYGTSRQAAFNIALYGRAMSHVPPYALGYNPYSSGMPYAPAAYPTVTSYPGVGYPLTSYPATGYPGTAYSSPGLTSPGYSGSSYAPYTSPYYDPFGGFLQGAASLVNADGKFRIDYQKANLVREEVKQAHIDNRRRAFDEFLYERANTPTWLDELERQKKLDLNYHLRNASGGEILEGISLNTLLDSLKQMQARNVSGPTVPLDEETLKQINVTAGSGANAGLLKNEGRLSWPLPLSASEYDEERKAIERNLQLAVSEVEKHGKVDVARLNNLNKDLDRMNEHLGDQISEMTPSQYIEARNYLRLLNDAIKALSRPDGRNYIDGKYTAQGKTVGELVKNMSGLKFAPAAPGDEYAYKKLYESLVTYYNKVQPSTGN